MHVDIKLKVTIKQMLWCHFCVK